MAATAGTAICKWDDDDWYGEGYCAAMADSLQTLDLTFLQPFHLLDLARWQVVESPEGLCSGATLVMP